MACSSYWVVLMTNLFRRMNIANGGRGLIIVYISHTVLLKSRGHKKQIAHRVRIRRAKAKLILEWLHLETKKVGADTEIFRATKLGFHVILPYP